MSEAQGAPTVVVPPRVPTPEEQEAARQLRADQEAAAAKQLRASERRERNAERARVWGSTALEVAGVVVLAYGLGLLAVWLGVAIAGLGLIVVGVALDPPQLRAAVEAPKAGNTQ